MPNFGSGYYLKNSFRYENLKWVHVHTFENVTQQPLNVEQTVAKLHVLHTFQNANLLF